MRIGIFIQARTDSTRLPGKVFEKIGDKEILRHVVEACKAVKAMPKINHYDVVVLAPLEDAKVAEWCVANETDFFQGSPEDLINRYVSAAHDWNVDGIIRVTADCWALPTEMIEETIKALSEADYASNCIIRSYPEGWDCQGISTKALTWVDENQTEEREHPFKLLDANESERKRFEKAGFTWKMLINPSNIIFQHTSIDTPEDLRIANERYTTK